MSACTTSVAVAVGHADRHDQIDAVGDLREIRRVQFGPVPEATWWPSRGTERSSPSVSTGGCAGRWLPSASPSPPRRHCRTRSRARCAGGCRRRTTSAPALRPGRAPSAPRAAAPRRSTALAPSPRPRTAGCRRGGRKDAATPHMCWSSSSWRPTLLWSKEPSPGVGVARGRRFTGDEPRPVAGLGRIWPIPRSRAYCSGCLAPGSRLAGHTTSAHTGASGPNLGA